MEDLEIVRAIKRELIRQRQEIEAMTNVEKKNRALKTYAKLLTSLEIGEFRNPNPRR